MKATGPLRNGVKRPTVGHGNHFLHPERPLAPHVVISPAEQYRPSFADVLTRRMEEGGHQPILLVPVVAGVSIPQQKVRAWSHLVQLADGFVLLMGVIPHHKVRTRGCRIERAELPPRGFLADFLAIARLDHDAEFVIFPSLQAIEPHTDDVIPLRDHAEIIGCRALDTGTFLPPLHPGPAKLADRQYHFHAIHPRRHEHGRRQHEGTGLVRRGFGIAGNRAERRTSKSCTYRAC